MDRIHIVLPPEEKELYRRVAARAGKSMSEWLREAAAEKAEAEACATTLSTRGALESFFAACDEQESGREPDWETHLQVMERSRASGTSGT